MFIAQFQNDIENWNLGKLCTLISSKRWSLHFLTSLCIFEISPILSKINLAKIFKNGQIFDNCNEISRNTQDHFLYNIIVHILPKFQLSLSFWTGTIFVKYQKISFSILAIFSPKTVKILRIIEYHDQNQLDHENLDGLQLSVKFYCWNARNFDFIALNSWF